MGTKRVVGRVAVLFAAVIAACFGTTPYLSSTQQMVMQASPGAVPFGMVLVGTDSPSQMVTLNNTMLGEVNTITSIAPTQGNGACPDFVPTFNVPPQGYEVANCEPSGSGSGITTGTGTDGTCLPSMYQFSMVFHPINPGPAACEYTVAYTTGGGSAASFTIQFSGVGMPPPNSLRITPTMPIGFGDVQLTNDSAPATVTVINNGGNQQTVTGANSDLNFTTVPAIGTFTLPSMLSRAYTVKCHPTTVGPKSGTLSFGSLAPPVSVAMTCNGIPQTGLDILPANFPSTLVGRPVTADISITNTTAATIVLAVGFTSTVGVEVMLTQNPSGNLGAGATAHAILMFNAATERQLGALANVTIGFSGAPATQSVIVNGEALKATLGTAPGTTIDFGPVCVGASPTMDVQLYASGLGPIQLVSVMAPNAPFTASATAGTMMGNHGNMIKLTAGVAPTAAGALSDKVVLVTDIPVTPNQELKLLASALPAGVSPTPAQVHFGPGHTMMTTPYKEILISNCGTAPITFTSGRIEGGGAASFAIVSQLPTAPLDPKGSTKVDVVMTPQSNGGQTAQLILEYAGGMVAVDLDGNGFGGDDSSKGDRSTYYSCNAGGGGAAGASVALLALLLRRRRAQA